MNKYLVKIYSKISEKRHFVIDLVEVENERKLNEILMNKIYYKDSDRKKILGTCKKIEIVNIF